MNKLDFLRLKIAAGRSTMSGSEFLACLDELQKVAVELAIPHIVPMRTKEDALRAHTARVGNGELPAPGPIVEVPAPQPASITPPTLASVPVTRKGGLTDEDRQRIRERYKQAKIGRVRVEKGWVKRIAAEYFISEAMIYNIVYSDPNYKAV